MIVHLRNHPATTGLLGSVSGWAAVDWLRSAQIAAALLAALVSAGTFMIIAPRILDGIMAMPAKWRKFCAWLRGDDNL